MSRRLRKEEEKLRQLKEEDDEVESKYELQMKRIYAPIIWNVTESGFRIQDAKEKQFDEILEIFKKHYIQNEVLCKNSELYDDPVSIESFTQRLLFYLKDGHSVIAVDENYKEPEEDIAEEAEVKKKPKKGKQEEITKIAGIMVTRIINKSDYGRIFSRVQLVEGTAMEKCNAFKSALNKKVDIFAKYECDSVLRYYNICVLPEYRKKGLGLQMMKCGLYVAHSLNVSVVMGLFSNCRLQKRAKQIGMEVLYERKYVEWLDKEGVMIFDDPGPGNYTLALMAGTVPSIAPSERQTVRPQQEQVEQKPQRELTRAEKKALLAKKAK